jgi:hypothetical protein
LSIVPDPVTGIVVSADPLLTVLATDLMLQIDLFKDLSMMVYA